MEMKPLYFNSAQPLSVKLDGPALRVSQEGKSCRRYPLCRVSRVTVSGQTEWATDALLACADAGINISFLNAGGDTRARFMGRSPAGGGLAQIWSNFLDRPDHEFLLAEWRENTRRKAISLCALRLSLQTATLLARPNALISVPPAEQRELEGFMAQLNGQIESRLVFELSRYGLDCENIDMLDLTSEIVIIVQWSLRPDLAKWWKKRNRRCDPERVTSAVAFLEKFGGTVDFQLREVLHGLYRFLRRLE